MPVYVFSCKKCKTNFEHLCKFDEIKTTRCPECDSKKIKQLVTAPNLAFAQPQESSKWDRFGYRAGHLLEKAKSERRNAEEKSHVGPSPYNNIDDLKGGEGILQ